MHKFFETFPQLLAKKSRLYGGSGHNGTIKLSVLGCWAKYKYKPLKQFMKKHKCKYILTHCFVQKNIVCN